MVLHHISQSARLFVIGAPVADAEVFAHRDLHVVDVTAIPDRFEDAVGKTEDHDVLDRLFAEIMVDPVHLALVEVTGEELVEVNGRGQIAAEGLFNDDPPPAFVGPAGLELAQTLDELWI